MKAGKTGLCVCLGIALAAVSPSISTGAAGHKQKDGKGLLPKTFAVKEAGIELTLSDSWFYQPAPPGDKIVRMLNSLRDLSRITLSLIPFQVDIHEKNFEMRSGELIQSVKRSHPDFNAAAVDMIPGSPARLHVEGKWRVEGHLLRVCIEIIPVKAKTVLLILTTQKLSGNTFRTLADRIRKDTNVTDKPLPVDVPSSVACEIGGREISVSLPEGWRPALEEETAFLEKQMRLDGLYAESGLLAGQSILVFPTLKDFSPTLTFRTSEGAVPVSEKNLGKFEALYRNHLSSKGGAFTVDAVTIETIAGISSFMILGTTKRTAFDVKSRQFFIPLARETIIVTLSWPEDEEGQRESRYDQILSGIALGTEAAAAETKKKDPGDGSEKAAEKESTALPWLAGGLVLAAAIILMMLILGRRRH